jgi:trans-aconitate methyltransferase
MRDYETYFKLMRSNLIEKADFIIEELDVGGYETVYDFGCANGDLTRFLADLFPDIQFIGIDNNYEVLKVNVKENTYKNIKYSRDLGSINNKTMFIFSSVLHELYSFNNKGTYIADLFLNSVERAGAVAIRDMYFSDTFKKNNYKTDEEFKYVKEFFKDKKKDNESFAEFLLKVRYKRNWNEEVKESYFSVEWIDIISWLQNTHKIIHFEKYMNEFLNERIPTLKDYTDTTHFKLIFKKVVA